jgi:hypothetical protein
MKRGSIKYEGRRNGFDFNFKLQVSKAKPDERLSSGNMPKILGYIFLES